MEIGKGMAGGYHVQILTQCGDFLTNIGGKTMVRCGGIRPPNDVPAAHCVEQALQAVHKELEMTLMGDLNAQLGDP